MAEAQADVGDVAQVKDKRSKAEKLRDREIRGMQIFLENPDNQWFVWRMLENCNMWSSMSRANPHDMAILSGKRDVGLWLIGEIEEAVPEIYLTMQRTAKEYMKSR